MRAPALRATARRLLAWYALHGRTLPWRQTTDPYRIWVSEAMLQQTTVKTVIPYYARFLKRFPDVAALARADVSEVLHAWSGLGYYRRARYLKRAAEVVVAEWGGRLPEEIVDLRALPGFGPYMAAAVASMAFDRPAPPVDANIRRVGARLLGLEGAGLDGRVREGLRPMFEVASPRLLANALMDLGATICLPSAPRCEACPLARTCRGRTQPERFASPVARLRPVGRHAASLVWFGGDTVFLVQGRERLLEGLWDLPTFEGATFAEARAALIAAVSARAGRVVAGTEPSFIVRHAIMNRRITRHVLVGRGRGGPGVGRRVALDGCQGLPLTATARKVLARLGAGGSDGVTGTGTGSGFGGSYTMECFVARPNER